MASLHIPEIDENTLERLQHRAAVSGRSVEDEAKAVLEGVLQSNGDAGWESVNALRDRLSASGRSFGDSAELIREDRER